MSMVLMSTFWRDERILSSQLFENQTAGPLFATVMQIPQSDGRLGNIRQLFLHTQLLLVIDTFENVVEQFCTFPKIAMNRGATRTH